MKFPFQLDVKGIMSRWRRPPSAPSAAPASSDLSDTPIPEDRGIPSVNRAASLQARASSLFAILLMSAIGLGLLAWYYSKALSRPARAQHAAQSATRNRAQSEMALPPLGPIRAPLLTSESVQMRTPTLSDSTTLGKLLGPAPELPPVDVLHASAPMTTTQVQAPGRSNGNGDRRLAGPAFSRVSQSESQASGEPVSPAGSEGSVSVAASIPGGSAVERHGAGTPELSALLRPTAAPAVEASVLSTRRFLLSKGAFIDCTLETAIDSTLPGMTTCITATDTFSTDGSVVLLERGTKLVGETRGQVQQGMARVFVLWTEARTPTGVVVPLASPGTDELGRSGVSGEVNRHFWDRFGAAILLSVIDGAVQAAAQSGRGGGSAVIVGPGASQDVTTEVLRDTVGISPTITKAQGDRIEVLVARDVDFHAVYALRIAKSPEPHEVNP
jgi:type IV secretion system protein VirB10